MLINKIIYSFEIIKNNAEKQMCMTLESEKCNSCLNEMKENSELIHKEIVKTVDQNLVKINDKVDNKLAQLDDKSTIFFTNQESKTDKLVSMVKWWIGVSLTLTLALMGGFGVYAFKIESLDTVKADKKEVPTMNEMRMLMELGDAYNRSIFIKKDRIIADTSAYYWARKNIYGSELRGVKK